MRFDPNFSSTVLNDITQSDTTFQLAEQQATTGLRVSVASDDPAAAAGLQVSQTESANVDQYTANTDVALSQVKTANSALSSVISLLSQAITLGTEGANGIATSIQKQDITSQVQGILSSVAAAANTAFEGVAVFGGTAGLSAAFVVSTSSPGGYAYQGNSSINTVQIGDTLSVQTNTPGSTIFTNPGNSVFGALSQLSAALASGNNAGISTATTSVTTALNYVSQQQAVYGNAINTLNSQDSYLSQEKVTLSSQQSSLVDVDQATAIENMDQAQIDNSAVLAAASKILPQSLLNYLK